MTHESDLELSFIVSWWLYAIDYHFYHRLYQQDWHLCNCIQTVLSMLTLIYLFVFLLWFLFFLGCDGIIAWDSHFMSALWASSLLILLLSASLLFSSVFLSSSSSAVIWKWIPDPLSYHSVFIWLTIMTMYLSNSLDPFFPLILILILIHPLLYSSRLFYLLDLLWCVSHSNPGDLASFVSFSNFIYLLISY